MTDISGLVSEDFLITSADAGIELFLRNKRPAALTHFSPERTLLIVHGGTQAVEATFDLALDGYSWADYIAARGWDVWLLDIRGFGGSTRPPEMDLPPEAAPPVARTATAWDDFGSAVAHILDKRGLSTLNALGWSWGTIIAGGWASLHPGTIRRLALFGAAWGSVQASKVTGGYSRWTTADALAKLQSGAPADERAALIPAHWRQAWEAATIATDDQALRYDPPQVRSPAGASADLAEAAALGEPLYQPQAIDAETLVVVGEWDGLTPRTGALALFDELTGASSRQYVEIGRATHFAHLEIRRLELFSAVQAFLDAPDIARPAESHAGNRAIAA
jgi:pimeloyl-ACP methyl ester carboxylesterase